MKRFTFLSSLLLLLISFGVSAQTLTDNFNAGVIGTGWQPSGSYSFTQAGGFLTVKAGTSTQNATFAFDLGSNANISANAIVNLKLRCSKPLILKMILVDGVGATSSIESRITNISPNFVNYSFDFTAVAGANKASIRKINFSANPEATSYAGNIYFEDLVIGATAIKLASITPISDVISSENKTAQKIIVTDIKNAGSITLTGGTHISGITYSAITNGVCTITYNTTTAGTDNVTLTANASVGYTSNTASFSIVVEGDNIPTVDQPADAKIAVGKASIIDLTGLTDGNFSIEQPLTITATSGTPGTIPNPTVTYTTGSPYASVSINPTAAGNAVITLTVKDNGATNNTVTKTFNVTSYNNFNYSPTIISPASQNMYFGKGTIKVKLTGISDGDGGTQTLTITATGKTGKITAMPVVYTQTQDTAIITLTAGSLGKDTITVSLVDNGGGTSNGNQTTKVSFGVEVLTPPPTGYKVVMNTFLADTTAKYWTIEGNDVIQKATYVDTAGQRAIRIQLKGKGTWSGLWYELRNLPKEIDVTNAPYMSYEICTKGISPIMSHAYFWSVFDTTYNRNTNGAHMERDTTSGAAAGIFHKVFLDFRRPGYLNDDKGNPINASRISRLLFNYHNTFVWPFTNINGTVYIRDIRIGDSCKNVPAYTPVCTLTDIATNVVWAVAGQGTIKLTGISNGKGSTAGVSISTLSSKTVFIPNPTISAIGTDGTATLTYNILNTNLDSAKIILITKSTGSLNDTVRFYIKTVSDNTANAIAVTVDANTKGQTITGFGGFAPVENNLDEYVADQGCTFMRLTIDPSVEINNDNSDPSVLDRSKFNKKLLDIDYIKKASSLGVTDFFITLWSPPSWMMPSLSDNSIAGAPDWATTKQKCDPLYYDEYVEYMVSIVRMIKEETGVEIAGFCPQNEPAFTEPYGSAILDPAHMATVCGLLGKRLSDEGFKTKVINSEQVFTMGWTGSVENYFKAVNTDALANQYVKVNAMHYPDATAALWSAQWAVCKASTYPKEYWATECTTNGNNYNAVFSQIQYMLTGFNYGLSAWCVWGYDQGSVGNEEDLSKGEGMRFGNGYSKHYWAFKNIAKYVKKGAVQLKSTSANNSIKTAAFRHDLDNTLTIVLQNTDTKLPYTIKLGGSAPTTGWDAYRTSLYEKCEKVNPFKGELIFLPPMSITTLYIKTDMNHAPLIDQVKDKNIVMNTPTTVSLTGISSGDPTNQTITITAVSSDPTIVPNPTVTYSSPAAIGTLNISPATDKLGTVTITVTLQDDGGTANAGVDKATMSFKVNVLGSIIEGLDDVSDLTSFYPNPASDIATLNVPDVLANGKLFISNITGQVIIEQKLNGNTQTNLNVSDLPSGSYLISIAGDKNIAKLKFVKK